jgi:hypothetical protein
MKKEHFAILLMSLAFSCKEEIFNTEDKLQSAQSMDTNELSVVASRVSSYVLSTGSIAEICIETYATSNDERTIAFTGADVKSFNQGTGEIVFEEMTFEQLRRRIHNYVLTFYLGEQELFSSATIGYDTVFIETNSIYDDLVFVMRDNQYQSLYLLDGFPALDWVAQFGGNVPASKQRREENALKRKNEWELFINYFREAGKLIE